MPLILIVSCSKGMGDLKHVMGVMELMRVAEMYNYPHLNSYCEEVI